MKRSGGFCLRFRGFLSTKKKTRSKTALLRDASQVTDSSLCGISFSLQVFLKSVMSVLERAFQCNQDEAIAILKALQVRLVLLGVAALTLKIWLSEV